MKSKQWSNDYTILTLTKQIHAKEAQVREIFYSTPTPTQRQVSIFLITSPKLPVNSNLPLPPGNSIVSTDSIFPWL